MPKTGDVCIKDPDATQWAKGIDWTDYCEERSTTITSSDWEISPVGSLTNYADSIVTGNLKTQIKLSGGTVDSEYTVTNRITTAAGGIDDRSFTVRVRQR